MNHNSFHDIFQLTLPFNRVSDVIVPLMNFAQTFFLFDKGTFPKNHFYLFIYFFFETSLYHLMKIIHIMSSCKR